MRSEFETLEQYQDSMKKFNENTRIGFENFIQSHGSERNKLQLRCTPYTDKKGRYGSLDLDFGLSLWQHQQFKVDELQKRVDELEIQLADWKRKSMPAMLNGMCGRCGKEPLQGIVSDKEDYALLHCFSCGANKYEWIGEQALKGGGE